MIYVSLLVIFLPDEPYSEVLKRSFFLDFGVLFCSRVESGAGVTVMSTLFALGRFLPDFLSLFFNFRVDKLLCYS